MVVRIFNSIVPGSETDILFNDLGKKSEKSCMQK
jgi:hypothetical protein